MPASTHLPPAKLDRRVIRSEAAESYGGTTRISDLAETARWLLLGEPGSGKSTTFEQAAFAHGVEVVTARRFVAGARPAGTVVFIDALEEFRIGEIGHDRLSDLTDQIAAAGYVNWRLTCRSASLSKADLIHIEDELGDFEVWNLGALDRKEQSAVLTSLGEADPQGFLRRVDDLAAAPLMGNPATLKLLHGTLNDATTRLESRGALFRQATLDMAHEINSRRAARKDRSTPEAIISAAEKASLVLMLSARSDLWMGATKPPRAELVTMDDLIPAGVDTKALHDAVDTPMFRGEADSYQPTHRMVSEYLAGRALAAAVSSRDGRPPALGYDRAFALLCGDDGKPTPALMGTFAWFVTSLAEGVHADRALALVKTHPEAILFQGDAAMLPTEHRRALLDATGRDDPWFLGSARGSTAVGGLAGPDLEAEFRKILLDPSETTHRRGLILAALAAGRRVPALDADVVTFASDPAAPDWLRREAIETIEARATRPLVDLRVIVTALDKETSKSAVTVRMAALAGLVAHDVTAAEVRKTLTDYAATGDGVMGYASSFGEALAASPVLGLFDSPLPSERRTGESRSFEVNGVVRRVLAQTILATPGLRAGDLLRWLANCGFKRLSDPEDELRKAIQSWVDRSPSHASRLFWALHRQSRIHPWVAIYEFNRLTGRAVPPEVTNEVLNRLDAAPAGTDAFGLARTALNLVAPFEPDDSRYWRLWDQLDGRADLAEVFEALTRDPIDHWQSKDAARKRKREAKIASDISRDRAWFDANLGKVRDGSAFHALSVAATVYAGHSPGFTSGAGEARLVNWMGTDVAEAIIEGWAAVMATFPITWQAQARQESRNRNFRANYIAAAFADHLIRTSAPVPVLSLDAAFGILRGYYVLADNEHRDAAQALGIAGVLADPDGMLTVLQYWRLAVRPGLNELPHAREFEKAGDVAAALLPFLRNRPNLPADVLRSAVAMAARVLPVATLAALVESALRKTLIDEARSIWAFAAFLLDPLAREAEFAAEAAGWPPGVTRLPHGTLIGDFDNVTGSSTARRRVFVQHLGPIRGPSSNFGDRDTFSEIVAGAIKGLGETPTLEATDALAALAALPALKAWRDTLQHYAVAQGVLRQQAEFQPPSPRRVAEALNAGPPATAADLRAVARECLADIANDIQNGDTAGWRAFWNSPGNVTARTPREENDCRDLVLDRLRDRLIRFGMRAHHAFPEARRRNDRRADILMIGEEAANLPVEAKRHMHPALWKAAGSQLKDYARSPGSAGQGVYLVFWFGPGTPPTPAPPAGIARISDAQGLKDALTSHLKPALRPLTDVIVIDVTPPPPRKRATSSKNSAKSGPPRPW
ncbi:hypothetical protein [Brevundimonas sp.]|uniref:hypothetical protein n=1 Tax=Brevundimonas sp. TaxID=1871086 RepID=UPI00356570E9